MALSQGSPEQDLVQPETTIAESGSAAPETQAPASSDGEIVAKEGTEASLTPEIPAFQPDFKFKAFQKDFEIPEWMRGAIKDADVEKQAKELFERAYGLDLMRPKYEETKTKYQELDQTHQTIIGNIQEAAQFVNKGEFDRFFEQLNIPEEAVLKYFLNKAKMMELPQEQQQAFQRQKEAERKQEQTARQLEQTQSQGDQRLVEIITAGLQESFARPEVQNFADEFDARFGKKGAFADEVVLRGDWHLGQGRVVTPSQVVKEVMTLAGWNPSAATLPQAGRTAAQGGSAAQSQAAPSQVVKPSTSIPAVSGRSSAPMSKGPESIDDLIALRIRKYGS